MALSELQCHPHPTPFEHAGLWASRESLGLQNHDQDRSISDLLQLVWRKAAGREELGGGSARQVRVEGCDSSGADAASQALSVWELLWFTKPERCGWSLDCQPGASSSRMGSVESGLARAGAETQRFFWELAEVGVEGVDLRSPLMPQATGEGCGGGKGNWSPGPAKGGDLMFGVS